MTKPIQAGMNCIGHHNAVPRKRDNYENQLMRAPSAESVFIGTCLVQLLINIFENRIKFTM